MWALFNYRWQQLSQVCCWFWEHNFQVTGEQLRVPSLAGCGNAKGTVRTSMAQPSKEGFGLWICPLMSSRPPPLPRPLPREQEGNCWRREIEKDQIFWPFGFIWWMALAENTLQIISVWHFLNKGFWSFVLNCHYFEICLRLERWKKVEAVKQQVKELWSLNKSISFQVKLNVWGQFEAT